MIPYIDIYYITINIFQLYMFVIWLLVRIQYDLDLINKDTIDWWYSNVWRDFLLLEHNGNSYIKLIHYYSNNWLTAMHTAAFCFNSPFNNDEVDEEWNLWHNSSLE